jgi:heme exporter protein A
LLPPAAGRLRWEGVEIAEDAAAHRARLHYVGHADALKPVLTVAETLEFWAGLRGGAAGERALAAFRLGALADQPCRFLSAGQRRRLALSRLFTAPAPLWLLDEPTTGLDRQSLGDLEEALARHRADGGLVVLSTHTPLDLPGAAPLELDRFAPAMPDLDAF